MGKLGRWATWHSLPVFLLQTESHLQCPFGDVKKCTLRSRELGCGRAWGGSVCQTRGAVGAHLLHRFRGSFVLEESVCLRG